MQFSTKEFLGVYLYYIYIYTNLHSISHPIVLEIEPRPVTLRYTPAPALVLKSPSARPELILLLP